jgi:hypothetical protein
MILSTVPGMLVLARAGIHELSRFTCAIFADLAMRGFAISFATMLRTTLSDPLLHFFDMLNSAKDSALCSSNNRTIKQITISVPTIPYPNIITSSVLQAGMMVARRKAGVCPVRHVQLYTAT